jgi:DNA mismatch repair ATPase MutS
LDRFLKILVQDLRKYVAICDEIPKHVVDKSGDLKFDRRVVRVITPGTLIDEKFMDPWENNYLLSVCVAPTSSRIDPSESTSPEVGLAWLDLSSGDFFTQRTNVTGLASAVARIGPREIVLERSIQDHENHEMLAALKDEHRTITYHQAIDQEGEPQDWSREILRKVPDFEPSKFSDAEVMAGGVLLHYVQTQLQGADTKLQAPTRREDDEFMSIDRNSMRALEIRKTIRDGQFEGSLLHSIRRTVTQSGGRLLSQRLCSPSLSLTEVQSRLDLVEQMVANVQFREDVIVMLRKTFDTLRLVQKFSFGKGDADDLIGLARTVQITAQLASLLKQHAASLVTSGSGTQANCIQDIVNRLHLEEPIQLADRIIEAIDEDALSEQHRVEDSEAAAMAELASEVMSEEAPEEKIPRKIKTTAKANGTASKDAKEDTEVWVMRRSASRGLGKLHRQLDELVEEKVELAKSLQEKLGAKTLTLRWTPGLGHICHVKGKDAKASVESLGAVRDVSSSKSTRSFHLPAWTHLGTRIDDTKARIRAEEQRVFNKLREQVVRNLVKLRRNAKVLDELDVGCGFATLAEEQGLVRPILNFGAEHKIIGGRHPTVETGLTEQGRQFISNDCAVGGDERILLITGPNMAGKSTFLRQNALISILAQTGSFVPAEYAEIGLVDKIFSRVGSADNLYQDQSTFMVEMLETAEILKQATPRSFVIMDEVGRGTTPEDGVAVGFACLHHLYHINQCRTLFATHFHALTDMTQDFEKLACYCTDLVERSDGSFSYVHKLRKGVNRQSHALKVAKLAGLPPEAIATAEKVIAALESDSGHALTGS